MWSTTDTAVVTVDSFGVIYTVAPGTGSVIYTVKNTNGCTNSKSVIGTVVACAIPKMVSTATINEQFILYPNPTQSAVYIKINPLMGNGKLSIVNYLGKTVWEQVVTTGTNEIDISKLAKGLYIVNIITSDRQFNRKLVVE